MKLKLYLFNYFSTAEASFKAAWLILPTLKDQMNKKESFLYSYIKQTISTLLVLPDNPKQRGLVLSDNSERGVLSVLRLLLNTLRSLDLENDHILCLLYIDVINMLSAMAQDELIYQVDKGKTNQIK